MEIGIVIGIVAIGLLALLAVALWGSPRDRTTSEIDEAVRKRLDERQQIFEAVLRENVSRVLELKDCLESSCSSVPDELDVQSAHFLLQAHRECSSDECACRQAALELLRLSGRYVPAQRAEERRRHRRR